MSNANNSGKRKMNEAVPGSYQQSRLPPATNQFDLFNFNAGSRGGNANHFPSPTNFPPPPNGHHFASTSNFLSQSDGRRHSQVGRMLNAAAPAIRPYTFKSLLVADDEEEDDHEDPIVTEMRSRAEQVNLNGSSLKFASPGNVPPRSNVHRFAAASNFPPPSNGQHFASKTNFPPPSNGHHFSSPSNIPPHSNGHYFASTSNYNVPPQSNGYNFASTSNVPPQSNGHHFAFASTSTVPPQSNDHHFAFASTSNVPPQSNGHNFASTSDVLPPSNGGHHSQVQQILNAAAPTVKPFSFMSLLMAEDHEDPLVTEMRSQTAEHVNQIITLHTDILQQEVGRMLERQRKSLHRAADEQATKKLKQKETQVQIKLAHNEHLERVVEHYKEEVERLSAHMRQLEEQTRSLKLSLEQVYAFRRYREASLGQEESSASSTPLMDLGTTGPIMLECKVCNERLSTVMMLQCRHVSVCKWCEPDTDACPVCGKVKRSHVELKLSSLN